jgi:hypothetical protein
MINIQELINAKLAEANDDKEREIKHWHPSKLGQCLRGVYLERLGVKPDYNFDERMLRVFDVGHLFENWVVELIKDSKGYKFETQLRVEDKALDVAGYADLLIKKGREKTLYEIKSKHSRSFWYMNNKGEGANQHHRMQLWLYLKLLGIKSGAILYLSKDDLSFLEYPILLDDKKLEKKVMEELGILNKCWKDKILPTIAKEGSWEARYCRWHAQCERYEKAPGSASALWDKRP